MQEEIETIELEIPQPTASKKELGTIRISTVLNLPLMISLFGSLVGVTRYRSIERDLRDIEAEFGTVHKNVLSAVSSSMRLRSKIIDLSSTRVMPLPVLRICIVLENEDAPKCASLQSSSYYNIPVWLSEKVTKAYSFDTDTLDDNGYCSMDCHLDDVRGHYIDYTSKITSEIIALSGSDDITIRPKRNFLVAMRGNRTSLYDGKEVIYKNFDGKYTIVYGCIKSIYSKAIVDVKKSDSTSCAIHICNDFVTHNGKHLPFSGLQCVVKMLECVEDRSIVITECARSIVIGVDSDYEETTLPDVGSVLIKTLD